jgi:hypothetical protein
MDTAKDPSEITITVVPGGVDQTTLATRSQALVADAVSRGHLAGDYRLVGHDFPVGTKGSEAPRRLRAHLYDYSRDATVVVDGDLAGTGPARVSTSGTQPVPSVGEFVDAVQVLLKDPELGGPLSEGRLRPYRPMPPVVATQSAGGDSQRTVAVGLLPLDDGVTHEIVGVNMASHDVVRFAAKAPDRSRATETTCGPPQRPDTQPPVERGTPGEYQVTISQGDSELWRFLAIRPAASSGTKGSGIELRNVAYRGKTVLRQAHVPILNVRYDDDKCGPYRDWQWQEGWFHADGDDVAPGFRRCPTAAKTILDTGEDGGNFPGVALYTDGDETVLVSEMEAGWYRYISQWRFHTDGTIRPRFGFAAASNSCVCNLHHHHVYWRFDFDIATPEHNCVQEFNDPPLDGDSQAWQTLRFETRRQKDPARQRRWAVKNVRSGEAYVLTPGPDDGAADDFGVGDLWALQHRDGEIDDGVTDIQADGETVKAHLDRFVDGRAAIDDADVVVWYSAHFSHDIHEEGREVGHIVGPELAPSDWNTSKGPT